MTKRLLWKLLGINILIIGFVIIIIWSAVDTLAAGYFMTLMEKYNISPTAIHDMFVSSVHRYLIWSSLAAILLSAILSFLLTKRVRGIARELEAAFGYPCFTKLGNGGSSVGVCKVKSAVGLHAALEEAAAYDRRVLIEQAVDGQEVECAVLGNDDPQASVVCEIIPNHEFYDYRVKYLDEGSQLVIPARLSEKKFAIFDTIPSAPKEET